MKKIIFFFQTNAGFIFNLLFFMCYTLKSFGQDTMPESGYIIASQHAISKALKDLPDVDEALSENRKKKSEVTHEGKRQEQHYEFFPKDGYQYANDTNSIQRKSSTEISSETVAAWIGQTGTAQPNDPTGAVGLNHYVQMVNSTSIRIYDKTGTVLQTKQLGDLWSPATANAGDPVVMYDKNADRWFLAQFGGSADHKIFIAISTSPDPTGTYYTYTFNTPSFTDYPKFGVWHNGYYMTCNMVPNANPQIVYAFDRTAMLTGTFNARAVYSYYSPPRPSGLYCGLPGDAADTDLPPSNIPCPLFSYEDNGWGTGYFDRINIYQMAVNWVPTIPTSSISLVANISTSAFDASPSNCSQPNTTNQLQGLAGFLMYRASWRNLANSKSVLLNWSVKISATQRAIKWCELRRSNTTGTWSMYQEGIYAPDNDTRWLGSMAMDVNGNIGLAYTKTNASSINPGIYYTGRRTCDPLGTLPITEVMAFQGTASKTNNIRIGDYSQMTLDPSDGISFWYTGEYIGGTDTFGSNRSGIFSFKIAAPSVVISTPTLPVCKGTIVNYNFVATSTSGGSAPTYQWKLNGINISGATNSTYSSLSLIDNDIIRCEMISNLCGMISTPTASNEIIIKFHENSFAINTTISPTTICQGANTFLTATKNYSTPTYTNGTSFGDYIDGVHIPNGGGWIITGYSGPSASPYYTLFTYSSSSLQANTQYPLWIDLHNSISSTNYVAAWIDFNQDKSFDPTERILMSGPITVTGSNSESSSFFTVPSNAVNGTTRLRVRSVAGNANIDPNSTESFGETEDYVLVIAGGTGTLAPTYYEWAQNISTTVPTVGASVVSYPAYSQQYTVQAADAYGCYTSTKTNPVLVNSMNIMASATPLIICSGASSTLTANVNTNYCVPTFTSGGTSFGNYISSLLLLDFTTPFFPVQMLSSTSGASSSPYYTLFPASGSTTATLNVGNSYTFYFQTGTASGNVIAAFLDYDKNGDLSKGLEKLGEISVGASTTGSITFTIPSWAKNGTTRLRILLSTNTNISSCNPYLSSYSYGEAEDYTVTITGGVNPTTPTFAWSPATSPSIGNSVSALPSTSTNYIVTATDADGCTTTTSAPVMVATSPTYILNNANPQWICAGDTTNLSVIPTNSINYCLPTYAQGTSGGDYISSVFMFGTSLSNQTLGASSSPYYTLFPQIGNTTATLTAGNNYILTINVGSWNSNNYVAAWIDYNGDGTFFSPLEKIGESGSINIAYGSSSFYFKVPAWAKNGTTRLRVREAYGYDNLEPCSSFYALGETEDYDISIIGGVAPLTYTWSTMNTSTIGTNVQVMPTYTQTYTITAVDGYNCPNSATIQAYVNTPKVEVNASSSSICKGNSVTLTAVSEYCQPSYMMGNTSGDYIQTVEIVGTSLNNNSGMNANSYTLYPASGNTTATLTAGNTYTITIGAGSRNFGNSFAAWIDFDLNNDLNNGIEKLGEAYNLNAFGNQTFVFTIPAFAISGTARLRVIETYFTTSINPCGNYMQGETEDYSINIIGGNYTAPTTYVWNSTSSGNPLTAGPLSSTAYTVVATDGNGCTKSAETIIEVNSVPAITASASPTNICAGTQVSLQGNYTNNSYCTPQYFNGSSGGNNINVVAIQGTSLNNTSGAAAAPFFTVYPASGNTTATLYAGATYIMTLTLGSNCCNNNISAWLDYDQNNTFEAGVEKIVALSNIPGSTVNYVSFSIPTWAKNGSVRLRVREAYSVSNMDPCATYSQGETEDYTLTIAGGIAPQPITFSWSPTTNPATGLTVNASPIAATMYTLTATDQYGCTNSSTVQINMNTPASFTTTTTPTTCIGTPTIFTAGAIACSGNAFSGNGTSYGASLLNSYALTATTNITMEAWVKWNGTTGNNQYIYYNGNSTSNGYGIFVNASNANKLSIMCGGVNILNSTATLTAGLWQHIAVTRSGIGTWRLFVDGVLFTVTNPNTLPIVTLTGGTYVGRAGTSNEYFNGAIDEVRIWNIAINSLLIPNQRVACITAPQTNLVGYWKFNEAIGGTTLCTDASGGNRTLTLSNASARTVSANYDWNFGDGGTDNGISVTHNYATIGNYTTTLTVTDITGCGASTIQMIPIHPCISSVNLKLFIEGYYIANGLMTTVLANQGVGVSMTDVDSVTVELRQGIVPFNVLATTTAILQTDGTLLCNFPNTINGNYGYIVIKHRNGLETWSNNPILFGSNTMYDFSSAASQAYGDNQVEVAQGLWALYSGDINLDENIDLGDFTMLENDINSFQFGYFATDINGDGNVDLGDVPIVETNINSFIFSDHP